MIRFLVDEDFNNDILRGLRRRLPDVDAPRIQALGLAGVSDETVLAHAASENRVVLTHDVSTLVASAYRRVEAAEPMPGVIAVAQSTLARVVIEDLVVIVECTSAEDWRDQVHYLPTHAHMLGGRWESHAEGRGELAEVAFPAGELPDDRASGGVGKGVKKARLGQPEFDFTPVRGAAAISLTTRLTIESCRLADGQSPRCARQRSRALRSTNPPMIELFDDFRDILVELHNAGARFVVSECWLPFDAELAVGWE